MARTADSATAMTLDEYLQLPVLVPFVDAARALGLSRSTAYELLAQGEFPVQVVAVGSRRRVRLVDLVEVVGIARPGLGRVGVPDGESTSTTTVQSV